MTKEISKELLAELEAEAEKSNGYTVFAKETKAPIFEEGFKCGAKSRTAQKIHTQGMISIEEHERLMKEFIEWVEYNTSSTKGASNNTIWKVRNVGFMDKNAILKQFQSQQPKLK